MKFLMVAFCLLIFINCGRKEDPYYVDCGDGSSKCKKLDQGELAKYIQTDREYSYLGFGVRSSTSSRDNNTIQSFLINMKYPRALDSQIYWAKKYDDELSCNFESYYGIIREEGARWRYDIKIIGMYRRDAYRCGGYIGDPDYYQGRRHFIYYDPFQTFPEE